MLCFLKGQHLKTGIIQGVSNRLIISVCSGYTQGKFLADNANMMIIRYHINQGQHDDIEFADH